MKEVLSKKLKRLSTKSIDATVLSKPAKVDVAHSASTLGIDS